MLKKFLSFVIALIILLSTFFQNTLYFQSKAASNLEIYTYSDYAEVYKCNGIGEVIIPSTYRGYTVTSIGSNSFSGAGVSRVVLPDTITRIGYSAFYNCNSLRTIIIPKSVKYIGDDAFRNCSNVTVYYGGTLEDWYKIDMTIQNGNYGLNVIPMSEHDHNNGVEIIKEPTCTEEGLKRTTCSICTYTNEEVIPATGHSYEEVITPPTVAEQGYTTYTCSSCGDNFIDNYVDAIGISLNGTITSYLSDTDEITITLTKLDEENVSYTTIVTGTLAEYSIEAIEPGTYTITVSKSNHTTRNYEITINNNETTQDIKICPIGDANGDGKITVLDYTQLLRHVKKTSTLDGYEFDCADVNVDGKLSVLDYTKLLRHVKKTEMLW